MKPGDIYTVAKHAENLIIVGVAQTVDMTYVEGFEMCFSRSTQRLYSFAPATRHVTDCIPLCEQSRDVEPTAEEIHALYPGQRTAAEENGQ